MIICDQLLGCVHVRLNIEQTDCVMFVENTLT